MNFHTMNTAYTMLVNMQDNVYAFYTMCIAMHDVHVGCMFGMHTNVTPKEVPKKKLQKLANRDTLP